MNAKQLSKKKVCVSILICICALIIAFSVSSFAWLGERNSSVNSNTAGSLITQYFHCGNGTEENPFVITRPVHYYNLVNLYQKVPEYSDMHYYFQLGYDLDGNAENGLEVYSYDDDGKLEYTDAARTTPKVSSSLNLAGLGALLPIGTHDRNFLGVFDGKGLTVDNLTIAAIQDSQECDIGIFGYVGLGVDEDGNGTIDANEQTVIKNTFFTNLTIDLNNVTNVVSEVAVPQTHNGSVHTVTNLDSSTTDYAYAGYIAGHVMESTQVTDVYINNATIVGGNAARTNFGYFGCIETLEGTLVPTLGEEIARIRGSGDDAGFGGSMNMTQIYNRLNGMNSFSDRQKPTQYASKETIIIDEVNNTRTLTQSDYRAITFTTGYANRYIYYNTDSAGSYYFWPNGAYMCLYGEDKLNKKEITTYIYKDNYFDGWIINDGSNYLSATTAAVTSTEHANDARIWVLDEENHLFFIDDGTKYYLNKGNGNALSVSVNPLTVWQVTNDNTVYTEQSAVRYFISYEVNGFVATDITSTYRLTDGNGHFVYSNGSSVSNTTESNASRWAVTNASGSTPIYILTSSGSIYLYPDANGNLSVRGTSYTWNKDSNGYYCNIQGIKHYIVYDNGWTLKAIEGKHISDGHGNFLSANSSLNGVVNTTNEEAATLWYMEVNGDGVSYFTVANGRKYYLTLDASGLSVSQTATRWHSNGNSIYCTFNGNDRYLEYDGDAWVTGFNSYTVIRDGSNYLVVNGDNSFGSTLSQENATRFVFENGFVYCFVGGTELYLRDNNGSFVTSRQGITYWTENGSALYTEGENGVYHALQYENSNWSLKTIVTSVLTDGEGNYLRLTGNSGTSFTNTQNINEATPFVFNGTYLYGIYNNQQVYLRIYNGSLQLTANVNNASEFTHDGSRYISANYAVYYDGTDWTCSLSVSGFKIRSGNNYLCVREDGSIYRSTNSSEAAIWSGTNGNIRLLYPYLGNSMYLHLTINNNSGTLSIGTATDWENNGNKLYFYRQAFMNNRYFYISYNGGWSIGNNRNNYNNASTLIFDVVNNQINGDSHVASIDADLPQIDFENITVPVQDIDILDYSEEIPNILQGPYAESFTLGFERRQQQEIIKTVESDRNGGYNTYFPIRILESDEEGYDSDNPYNVSPKNTGYIIGGARIQDSGQNNQQKAAGDIRISRFPIGDISTSYTPRNKFSNIFTYNASGRQIMGTNVPATDTYTSAKDKLEAILSQSSSYVYGLHFMEAEISTNSLVTAKKVTLLGEEYDNYEMPLDSIDFHVVQRGSICFFAGNYYPENNTFFSLHRIFRDENTQQITAIKEIQKVYVHKIAGIQRSYIYQFKGENNTPTYTNPDGTYTEATSYDSELYELAFDTEWIKSPGFSDAGSEIYYFEIPCNEGEYALGSVPGKTGAYLIYLDIATNGGDILDTVISSDGNGLTQNNFKVDVRSVGDSTPVRSLMQLAVDAPANADMSNFSVSVSFTQNVDAEGEYNYPNGLYTITVVNRTNADISLDVFICDDDDNIRNDYPYAYKIVYTNNSSSNKTMRNGSYDYFKQCQTHTIPYND